MTMIAYAFPRLEARNARDEPADLSDPSVRRPHQMLAAIGANQFAGVNGATGFESGR
jgi:hypothetical protein